MIEIENKHFLSFGLKSAHQKLQDKSDTYKKICDKIIKEGGAKVKILDNKQGAEASWIGGHVREIHLKAVSDQSKLAAYLLFEMTNAYHESKFKEIDEKAKKGYYKKGKYGIPAINYSAASERIEYEGMRLTNIVLDEMLKDNKDPFLWKESIKWYIPDFDKYFITQIRHGHSDGTIDHYLALFDS